MRGPVNVIPDRVTVNASDVAAKVIEGEAIIISLATGVYYSMDGVGGRLWELVEGSLSTDAIVGTLLAEYDVAAERCRADVATVIASLLQEGLVVPAVASAGDAPGVQPVATRKPYAPPTLSIYRDMADLLALDPPLPGLGLQDPDASR